MRILLREWLGGGEEGDGRYLRVEIGDGGVVVGGELDVFVAGAFYDCEGDGRHFMIALVFLFLVSQVACAELTCDVW